MFWTQRAHASLSLSVLFIDLRHYALIKRISFLTVCKQQELDWQYFWCSAISHYCIFTEALPRLIHRGFRLLSSLPRLRFSSHRGEFAAMTIGKDEVLPRANGPIVSSGTVHCTSTQFVTIDQLQLSHAQSPAVGYLLTIRKTCSMIGGGGPLALRPLIWLWPSTVAFLLTTTMT